MKGPRWKPVEDQVLVTSYAKHQVAGTVDELATFLGRPSEGVRARAKSLGLTSRCAAKGWLRTWKSLSDEQAAAIFEDFEASGLSVTQFADSRGYGLKSLRLTLHERIGEPFAAVMREREKQTRPFRTQRGMDLEKRIANDLSGRGYHVFLSPRSKSPVDVVAVGHGDVRLVQVKATRYLSQADRDSLAILAESVNASAWLAYVKQKRVVYERLVVGP